MRNFCVIISLSDSDRSHLVENFKKKNQAKTYIQFYVALILFTPIETPRIHIDRDVTQRDPVERIIDIARYR